jgi:hypothetical protein
MLTLINDIPFSPHGWPGMGIWAPGVGRSFEVVQFSRRFSILNRKLPIRIHVTADQQYKLYLDGQLIGLGPQRGDLRKWYFDSYDLSDEIGLGEHVLTAVVWHDRDHPPTAQISHRPMFLLAAEAYYSQILGTSSDWRCFSLTGINPIAVIEDAFNTGCGLKMTGITQEDLMPSQQDLDGKFVVAEVQALGMDHRSNDWCLLFPWRLHPRTIPSLEACVRPLGKTRKSSLPIGEGPIFIPPYTRLELLLDHETLTMGYPMVSVKGGKNSRIQLTYQEAMQKRPDDVTSKGHRGEIDDRTMVGIYDVFHPDGRNKVTFEPLWFRCWRYIFLEIQTNDNGLEIDSLTYRTTGYPLELCAEFHTEDKFHQLVEPGFRTLRLCCADTFMDCPYYEQLQYIGDTRIMAMLTYVLTGDDRLARQAMDAFDRSRLPNGLTQARYPSRSIQVISTFSLFYIAMVNDFLMWRGDLDFVKEKMYGIKSILLAFERYERSDCLIEKLPNWSFIDWVQNNLAWVMGVPPGANEGRSYLISFLYLYILQLAKNLFVQTGDLVQAQQIEQKVRWIQERLRQVSWNASRQLFVDDFSGEQMSQHTNILALLTNTHIGLIDGSILLRKILDEPQLARVTQYFSFYLFEAMYHVGYGNLIWISLNPWYDMLNLGLTTFAETPEPTRSDCHGWSAHPLYHYFSSILGVRPAAPGCSKLSIRPAKDGFGQNFLPNHLGGVFMTPQGKCRINLTASTDGWRIQTSVPSGITVISSENSEKV